MRVSIKHNNIYQRLDTEFIANNMPVDTNIVSTGNNSYDTMSWEDDICLEGDSIVVRDNKMPFPIGYQSFRFHRYKKDSVAGQSRSRSYNVKAQLLIPRSEFVIGYVGTVEEFNEIYRELDSSTHCICVALDAGNIGKYDWGCNVRFVPYSQNDAMRSVVYRSMDVLINNNNWPRPRLEAISSGIPVVFSPRELSDNLYKKLRPKDNDIAVQHDISYFIRDFVDEILELPVESPLISICINIYNREHLIAFAIESALLQSYTNIELILVDDGSSDRSVEIAKHYESIDDRVTLKVLKKNVGCPASWSESMKMANGQLITYTSSDNIQDYGQIWHLNRYWQKNSKDIVYAKPRYFGGSNKVMYSTNVNRNLALSCAGLGPSFLIPKWLIDESDLMHSEDLYVEDTSLTADLCTMGAKVERMGYKPLYYYRDGDPNSLTSNVMQMGGYSKLLSDMSQNRINRRNECVKRLKYVYIPEVNGASTRAVDKLRMLGFSGDVYVGKGDFRGAIKGIPNREYDEHVCSWGCHGVVIGSSGEIYRCPYKDVIRGKIDSDFFLNKSPRPCWKLCLCEEI